MPWGFSKSLVAGVFFDVTGPMLVLKDAGKFAFDGFVDSLRLDY
jgi:hypothetical protein